MLYTVTPLERIYSNQVQSLIISRYKSDEINSATQNEVKCIDLQHGKVYARRDGDNYIVDGIISTNMSDYLDEKYCPGAIVK